MRPVRLFLIALQFLTIIPLPCTVPCDDDDLGRSAAFFPLVGLVIGGMLCLLDVFLSLWLVRPLTDALLVTGLVVVTGALHLDGLADVCDGIAARGDRDRFLAVMKDSRVGAVGVVGIVLGLLLTWQALVAVPADIKWQALLIVPVCSRLSQVVIMCAAPHARQGGLGALFISGMGYWQLAGALVLAAGIVISVSPVRGVVVLAATILTALAVRRWFIHRLGGITGDIIGFGSELCGIAVLVLFGIT